MDTANRKVVTGATGFLGGKLAREFKRQGYEVIGSGRNYPKGIALEREGIHFVRGDLSDKAFADSLVREGDDVFHCAAKVDLWGMYDDFLLLMLLQQEILEKRVGMLEFIALFMFQPPRFILILLLNWMLEKLQNFQKKVRIIMLKQKEFQRKLLVNFVLVVFLQ